MNPLQTIARGRIVPATHGAEIYAHAMDTHQQDRARNILENYIQTAASRAQRPIERIMNEIPNDSIVRGQAMTFRPVSAHKVIEVTAGGSGLVLHDHALTQIAQRLDMPIATVRELQERAQPWSQELLAHSLTEHARNVWAPSDRFLARAVGGQLRGFLSDKFRRIDCRPILDVLIGETQKVGAMITDAVVSDVRASVRFLLPRVLEIAPSEFVALGMEWTNSDYGKGKNALSAFLMRVWCLNGAILSQELAQIHLGGRLSDSIEYSRATIEADSRAATLAARDTARALLAPGRQEATIAVLQKAANEPIDAKASIADMRKRLGKTIADKVAEAYNMADVEALPLGNTAWRMSNAISWVAKAEGTSADTRVDLEREAGTLLK